MIDSPRIRVLVADDSTLLRALLCQHLAQYGDCEVVAEASDGMEAVAMAARHRPDVVVMDLSMPGLNGVQATERILTHNPHTRVLVLTGYADLASLGRLAGAHASMSKDCRPEELMAAIRDVLGSPPRTASPAYPPAELGATLERLSIRAGLTERERTVLRKLVEKERTIRQLAGALSAETGQDVTDSSVRHTLDRVMTKLRVEPRTRASLLRLVMASMLGSSARG